MQSIDFDMIGEKIMDKAVVVGGSNGIGLAIANNLLSKGYFVYIVDRVQPNAELLTKGDYQYVESNLMEFDENIFSTLAMDSSIRCLMLTAGLGRVADFEYLHIAEIEKLMRVNAISAIKIIRLFYERIKNESPFYCGVMGSIAGLISSPMFSVYAASKAAICRFIESVNVELEAANTQNRILNVSPGSLKGTKFNGGENDLSQLVDVASVIVDKIFARETLFIPQYEETYANVLARYQQNAAEFGQSSYQYKKQSGRVMNEKKVIIGYLSGTFDLFHIGHLNLLRKAKAECDYLIVGVHKDGSWKGKETYIPFNERVEILKACKYVDKVVQSFPEDSDAYDVYKINKLFVGSDYKGTERFNRYEEYFKDKNVQIVYFPYTQGTSSTQLREKLSSNKNS